MPMRKYPTTAVAKKARRSSIFAIVGAPRAELYDWREDPAEKYRTRIRRSGDIVYLDEYRDGGLDHP